MSDGRPNPRLRHAALPALIFVVVTLVAVGLMIVVLLAAIRWIFLTGWRLRD